jgi:hypothetical protein
MPYRINVKPILWLHRETLRTNWATSILPLNFWPHYRRNLRQTLPYGREAVLDAC